MTKKIRTRLQRRTKDKSVDAETRGPAVRPDRSALLDALADALVPRVLQLIAGAQMAEQAGSGSRRSCMTPFGVGFIGPRSARPVHYFRADEPRESNVLKVLFEPLDQSGAAYVTCLTRREIGVRSRRCRACGAAGHDRRTCKAAERPDLQQEHAE